MAHDSAPHVLRRSATPRVESSTWADQILGSVGATAPMRAYESVVGELEEDLTLLGNESYHLHQNEKVFLKEYVLGATEGSTPVGSANVSYCLTYILYSYLTRQICLVLLFLPVLHLLSPKRGTEMAFFPVRVGSAIFSLVLSTKSFPFFFVLFCHYGLILTVMTIPRESFI